MIPVLYPVPLLLITVLLTLVVPATLAEALSPTRARPWWWPATKHAAAPHHPFLVACQNQATGEVWFSGAFGDPERAHSWCEALAQVPNRRVQLIRVERVLWLIRRWTPLYSWVSR